MFQNFLEMLKMQVLRYYTEMVSFRGCIGWDEQEEGDGGLKSLLNTVIIILTCWAGGR